jgi:hypothetical protein
VTSVRAWLVVLLAGLAGCGACEPDRSSGSAGAAGSGGASGVGMPPPPPVSVTQRPHVPTPAPPKLACRAIAADGDVRIEAAGGDAGSPVLLQGLVPTEAWVVLAKGARLVAKDPRTTRETTFRGPGRARACVDYGEESWLTAGIFESSVGAGEGPGLEEWVVTPYGVVRYGVAKLGVEIRAREAFVRVDSGVAFAWSPLPPADAGTDEGWARLLPGTAMLSAPRGEAPADGTKLAVDRCTTLATSARHLAEQVMAPGGADAGTITAQVTTRRLARAACAVATVRVRSAPQAEAAVLAQPLADANAAWSGLPSGPNGG